MATPNDIYNEITRIDNAKQGIAEAIEEKGVQVPAGTPIQDLPGKVRQIQTGSPDAVLYTPQDLTPEQQEQARTNIGATAPEIFWVTYGVTTVANIEAAISSGKQLIVSDNGSFGMYYGKIGNAYYFFGVAGSNLTRWFNNNGTWQKSNITIENADARVSTIIGNETDTYKYPNTKAVADYAVQSLTASGKKIWAGTQSEYNLLTPANDTIYFIVPTI